MNKLYLNDLTELWKHLFEKYGIIKDSFKNKEEFAKLYKIYIDEKKFTSAYYFFGTNIYRSLSTYQVLEEGYELLKLKNIIFNRFGKNSSNEMLLILLITSIEVYFRNCFELLAFISTKDSIKVKYFPKFTKILKISQDQQVSKFLKKEINLYEMIMNKMNNLLFQQKEICSIAFKLCNIDIPHIDDNFWEKLFGKPNGYIKLRNYLIHQGFWASGKYENILTKENINTIFFNIVDLVNKIDLTIVKKYPNNKFPALYMTTMREL